MSVLVVIVQNKINGSVAVLVRQERVSTTTKQDLHSRYIPKCGCDVQRRR
jgi:hypothetical protein